MDKGWLKYCATDEQLQTFNDEGYLIVNDAISSEMVEKMTIAIDRIDGEERTKAGARSERLDEKVPYHRCR